MKVHRETIDALSALYENGHRILEENEGASMDADEALEAAAIDYMVSSEHTQFYHLIDNLDDEVCRELIALMQLGRDRDQWSAADFDRLKSEARTGMEAGDFLFSQKRLPEYWKAGLKMMGE